MCLSIACHLVVALWDEVIPLLDQFQLMNVCLHFTLPEINRIKCLYEKDIYSPAGLRLVSTKEEERSTAKVLDQPIFVFASSADASQA